MKVPAWAAQLAAEFWRAAGRDEPFPRDLQQATAFALPVTLVYLRGLRLNTVRAWLERNQVWVPGNQRDRGLCACLVAIAGGGVIFVDSADDDDEQRFSLAHELAHYLRDYWQPRLRIQECMAEDAIEVIDGQRPARADERLLALLARVPLEVVVHLLERNPRRRPQRRVAQAEADADRLAYELLAPAASVWTALSTNPSPCNRETLQELLRHRFGLPVEHAQRYAELLLPAAATPSPLLMALREAR